MNLIIIGPQGSGKGTQAELLAKKFGLFYLEAGAIIREKAKENSDLGKKINEIANTQGKLLPDEMTISLIEEKLDSVDIRKGVIFDGYPRSLIQFKALEEYLQKKGQKIDRVIFLTLSEAESLRRLSARRVCEKCGANFNLTTRPSHSEGVCDACGGRLIQRADDTSERIRARLKEYQKQTVPLVSFWRRQGILEEVDGERPIEVIFEEILERLGR